MTRGVYPLFFSCKGCDGMYITYEYYLGTYGGRHASTKDFTGLEARASSMVNHLTFNRVNGENLTEPIKLAICEIVDGLAKLDETGGKIITSESVGTSVSMSYDVSQGDPEMKKARSILMKYIGHTGLLYRGV